MYSLAAVYACLQGLVHKFLAIEEMFDRDPTLAERVSFVQVIAPIVSLA
jgi:trehalose-6-phosphate synthase